MDDDYGRVVLFYYEWDHDFKIHSFTGILIHFACMNEHLISIVVIVLESVIYKYFM